MEPSLALNNPLKGGSSRVVTHSLTHDGLGMFARFSTFFAGSPEKPEAADRALPRAASRFRLPEPQSTTKR
jgi:hypothetical protein